MINYCSSSRLLLSPPVWPEELPSLPHQSSSPVAHPGIQTTGNSFFAVACAAAIRPLQLILNATVHLVFSTVYHLHSGLHAITLPLHSSLSDLWWRPTLSATDAWWNPTPQADRFVPLPLDVYLSHHLESIPIQSISAKVLLLFHHSLNPS